MTDELDKMIRRYGDELGRAQRRDQAGRGIFRSPARILAVGMGTGLAVVAALALIPGNGGQLDPLERAQAALQPNGKILHIVMVQTLRGVRGASGEAQSESWLADDRSRIDSGDLQFGSSWDPSKRVTRKIGDRSYRVVPVRAEQYNRKTNQYRYYNGFIPPFGSANEDPTSELRRLLAAGGVKEAARTTIDGRKVRRFVTAAPKAGTVTVAGKTIKAPRIDVEYFVDAETFAPVEFRYGDYEAQRFKVFERLPRNAETEKLLRLDVPADAQRRQLR